MLVKNDSCAAFSHGENPFCVAGGRLEAWRARFGRVLSEVRRPLQGGGLGRRASGVVVGVGIVSARRSGLSGVSKNVGQRFKVRSASTE